jgi:lysophospholipase-2
MAATVNLSKGAAELLRNAVVVNAATKHSATLLFLHGLGDTGHGWAQILTEVRPPFLKIVCPTAFDIYSLDKAARQDEEGIQKAASEIHELLDAECAEGLSPERVVIGGFSQGGSLAIFSALTYPKKLAGIVGMSTYVSINHILEKKMTDANKKIPFLQCHGDSDPVVAYQWGQLSSQFITTFNSDNYQFKTYAGLGHSSCPQEMADVKQWLQSLLQPHSPGNL